ncbi:BTB/POZ domain-containing protein POB1 [Acorus calamus]|uniref:BTB/POZ domain-containing protein POB1 n=1 Tax=Acorus calamus TaxID=4465 RepID=A0AAV9F664_ACOCL|nr:BTB/POZ domain-containing protein POB1 [Acorus calamus]
MKESGGDLFNHQFHPHHIHHQQLQQHNVPVGGGEVLAGMDAAAAGDRNFEFAFNQPNFSDRILRIEIVTSGLPESKSDGEGCSSIAEWARNRKRRREDIKKDKDVDMYLEIDASNVAGEFAVYNAEQDLNCVQPDSEDLVYENHDGEAVAMLEESPSGDEGTHSNESSWSMECTSILKVKTIYVCSAILAEKSPFFLKLFSNGMRESDQRHATLRINASEETALMELLRYMYSGKLSISTAPALLDVLMAADKFEVISCMSYCSKMLRKMDMTVESALLYLDLPSSVSFGSAVQSLTDAAKEFLASRYKDITKFQDELLNLPLPGIEALLASDTLQVASEDAIYDFVLKWARLHYPKLEERREVLGTRLARLIRFPYMTSRKLRKVLSCNDFDHELASKLVLDALFFKSEIPHRQRSLVAEDSATSRRFVERAFKYRPVKVVEFSIPHPQCIVYLDLKREECANLFPAGRVYSQAFHLGGQGFFLSAHCNVDQQSNFHCFGLFLGMQEKGSVSFPVEYEFAARTNTNSNTTKDFVSKYKGSYTFTGGKAVGYRNLFAIPWTSFMAEDSLYFIDGTLHLRAELTIRQTPQPLPVPPL